MKEEFDYKKIIDDLKIYNEKLSAMQKRSNQHKIKILKRIIDKTIKESV